MQEFKNIQGTQQIVPLIECNIDTVYIRSNIKDIHTTEMPILWQYDEMQLTKDEYCNLVGGNNADINAMRLVKLQMLDGKCSETIYGGVDIESYHYNFTVHTQLNLNDIKQVLDGGETQFKYKADNETIKRWYPAAELYEIILSCREWKAVNTQYYDMLKTWINRETDEAILCGIEYGSQLPTDLSNQLISDLTDEGVRVAKYTAILGATTPTV